MFKLEDVRQYVFPIHLGSSNKKDQKSYFQIDKKGFLGTGFLITKTGVALSAAHCVPDPKSIEGKSISAGLWDGNHLRSHKIISSITWPNFDIALIKLENSNGKFLPLSFEQIYMGMDIFTVGIPSHSIWQKGIEVRCLKGHVTFSGKFLELSFAAPRGMSGSPVFSEGKVIGVISGNVRSEDLEDQIEEIVELTDDKEKIKITETKSVINYGLAEQIKTLRNEKHEMFENRTFEELILYLNDEKNS